MQSKQFHMKREKWIQLNNEFDQMFLKIVDNPEVLTSQKHKEFKELQAKVYELEGAMFAEVAGKHLKG